MGLLDGKVAVVTGAGRGLGAAMAKAFAREGAGVVVMDIDQATATATTEEISAAGGQAWGEALDCSDRAAVKRAAERLTAKHGAIHVLVNNAGIAPRVGVSDENLPEMWDRVIGVNLNGPFYTTVAFLPALKKEGGSIIYTASISAFIAPRSSAAYGAAKSGLVSLTKYMARELAPFGIRVNALAPGVMITEMTTGTRGKPGASRHLERTPMARNGEADEMAGPALFLASDMSTFVTGVTIPVDGGFLAT